MAMYLVAGALLGVRHSALPSAVRLLSTSTAATTGAFQPRPSKPTTFCDFAVLKSNGAAKFTLIPPTWRKIDNGNKVLDREGVLLGEFASALKTEQHGGAKTYLWDRKISFALKAHELGTILANQGPSQEFYHDPLKGQQGKDGAIHKTLAVSTNEDGSKVFKVSQSSKGGQPESQQPDKRTAFVPLTHGEFEAFKALARFSIPLLLGFDVVLGGNLVIRQE